MRYVAVPLLIALHLAPAALAQDAAPVGSIQALLARARAFQEDDGRFDRMRLELGRALDRAVEAERAARELRDRTPAAALKDDPELRRRAELLALEAQAAREAHEALATGAGRARLVSLAEKQARALPPLLSDLDRALEAQDDVELRLARGELLAGKSRFEDARRDAEAAIRARPEDPRALALLAMCLVADNRFEEAEALFRAACEEDPRDERRAYHAIALYCVNRFAEARAVRDAIAEPRALPARLQVRSGWWLTDAELDRAQRAWAREEAARRAEAARDDLPRVELVTSRGAIVIELFEDLAPNAVAGVVSLVEAGFYDGLPWTTEQNRVARAGAAAGPADPRVVRLADDEAPLDPDRRRAHLRGSVSLAREEGQADSGASELLITLMPTSALDGVHAVIGRVLEGQRVADALRDGDRIERARVLRKRDHPYAPVKAR